jgi:hypothetical protein
VEQVVLATVWNRWKSRPGSSRSGGTGGVGATIATTFFGPTAGSYGTPGPAPGRYFAGGGAAGTDDANPGLNYIRSTFWWWWTSIFTSAPVLLH